MQIDFLPSWQRWGRSWSRLARLRSLATASIWLGWRPQEWKQLKPNGEFCPNLHEQQALAGVSEGCCWAMHDLKMDCDSTVGVDGTSLFVYHGGELACGDRSRAIWVILVNKVSWRRALAKTLLVKVLCSFSTIRLQITMDEKMKRNYVSSTYLNLGVFNYQSGGSNNIQYLDLSVCLFRLRLIKCLRCLCKVLWISAHSDRICFIK